MTAVPIYKKGSKATPGNYRPVSLTYVCCTMMESLIKDDIMQHLTKYKLINTSQHCFMKGKSCTTNLGTLYIWTSPRLSIRFPPKDSGEKLRLTVYQERLVDG